MTSMGDVMDVDQINRLSNEIDQWYQEWILQRGFPLRDSRLKMLNNAIAKLVDDFLKREKEKK